MSLLGFRSELTRPYVEYIYTDYVAVLAIAIEADISVKEHRTTF
jgi:hypothetical protein